MIDSGGRVLIILSGEREAKKAIVILLVCLSLLLVAGEASAGRFWNLPPLPAPHQYGDILIDRLSTANNVKAVSFSHWSHRSKYTCRVCHWELDFAFKAGGTEITEAGNRYGLYCGTCHDGKVAFGHTDKNCKRCHTGRKTSDVEKFTEFRYHLPKNNSGNNINWVAALRNGSIKPAYSIYEPEEKPFKFRKRLELSAEWAYVPPAYFRHDTHVKWLDCGNCHPDIFNIKKKTTKHFRMDYILDGKFCGVCHLRVAFPIDICSRCHPAIQDQKVSK